MIQSIINSSRVCFRALVSCLAVSGLLTGFAPAVSAETPWSTEVTEPLLREVMPAADSFSDKQGTPPVYHAFRTDPDSGEQVLAGYVFLSADVPPVEKGYSAPIDMLIGLSVEGRLTGIKVLHYVESFRSVRGDFLAREGFQEQFQGKSLDDEFRVRHDIDGVSSATISSWAITRTVRNTSHKVAAAYLDYQPAISDADIWAANAAQQLAKLSWQDLIQQGLVVQAQVPLPLGTFQTLSIAYMGHPVMGQYLVGKNDYVRAERDASIRFDTPQMVLFAVGGDTSSPIRQERFSYRQGEGPPQRFHARQIVTAGSAKAGAIAGNAEYAGGLVMDDAFDPTQPFEIIYRPMGGANPIVIPYQLSGVPLSLVKGEAIAAPGAAQSDGAWRNISWTSVVTSVLALITLLGAITLAFLRKSSRLRWAALAGTFVYLGFINGGFLSISHLTGFIAQGPAAIAGNLPLLILVLFTLVTTLLWGRLFCGSLCPFGALQDFISRFTPNSWRLRLPAVLHQRSLWIKYAILALIVVVAFIDSSVSIFQYFEPFGTLFYFSPSMTLWVILAAMLAGCVLVERFYCRYLCPLGAALALMSFVSFWKIKRVPQCGICKVCENACPTGAIEKEKINFPECVRCDICEIKLIEKAGTCRHSVETIAQRSNSPEVVRIMEVS